MIKKTMLTRVVALTLLLAFLQFQFSPIPVMAEETECDYDRNNPSLDNARKNFLALNYDCAEQELNDLLAKGTLETVLCILFSEDVRFR